jgi:PAT family beta-lactamase induction signal transducer AmpG
MSSTLRRLGVTCLHGFSSALPLALTGGTLQAWLATDKVDIQTIGWFSLIGLPYTLKVFWAPLFDRFTSHWFLGPRRGWILITQLLLILTLIGLALSPPLEHLQRFAILAFLTAFFSANQDIVIDAYRTEVLLPSERGQGGALFNIGARIAHLSAGAGALILADRISWPSIYFGLSLTLLIGVLASLIGPEPAEQTFTQPNPLKKPLQKEVRAQTAVITKSLYLTPFRDFFSRPQAVLLISFVVFYKMGDAFSVALATPFLMSVGYTKTSIGMIFKGAGMLATIIGSTLGGFTLNRFKLSHALFIFGTLQAITNFGYIWIANVSPNLSLLTGVIAADQFASGLGSAAFIVFLTGMCKKEFAATQFALLTSFMALTRVFVGGPAAWVAAHWGWPQYFLLSLALSLPGFFFLFAIRKDVDAPTDK